MLNILFYIFVIIIIIILFSTSVLLLLWAIGNLRSRVPFVTASRGVLKDIKEAFSLADDSVVYDLGCGDGRILFYLATSSPKAKYIGIEHSTFPFILAKLGSFLNYKKTGNNVEILQADFFKKDLSNATHIFTYLYPNLMDELLSKFEKEFKPGTKLVSLSFKFTNKTPFKEIDLARSKYKLGRKLYVYQF